MSVASDTKQAGPGKSSRYTEDWRELVDLERLREWMDDCGLEHGDIAAPRLLSGGSQNILLQFRRGAREFVLRRPPRHPRADGNVTIRREAAVLAALRDTSVPHPRLIAACGEPDILGAAFYLMEPVQGVNATVDLPRGASTPSFRRQMAFAFVDGAIELAKVDHVEAGLADFGKVDGFLKRQALRWRRQLDGYHDLAGWPGPDSIPGLGQITAWLEDNRPRQSVPGVLHGDYHMANVMFMHNEPRLAAIVDWELATVGDPLVDLGWIMATWPEPDGTPSSSVTIRPWEGFPAIGDLVEYYKGRSARRIDNPLWYGVLGCYKLGIILEGSYARACAGRASMAVGERHHASCLRLFRRALGWLETGTLAGGRH